MWCAGRLCGHLWCVPWGWQYRPGLCRLLLRGDTLSCCSHDGAERGEVRGSAVWSSRVCAVGLAVSPRSLPSLAAGEYALLLFSAPPLPCAYVHRNGGHGQDR